MTTYLDLPPTMDVAALCEAADGNPGSEEVVARVCGSPVATVHMAREFAEALARTLAGRGGRIIGIDPGVDGAVAVITMDGAPVGVWDVPTVTTKGTRRDYLPTEMAELLRGHAAAPVHVALEAVTAAPVQGRRQGTSSMFAFGRGVGLWEGIIAGLGLPVTPVRPQAWKRTAGIPAGSDKGASRKRAAALFPALSGQLARVKDDGRAEALLIAWHLCTVIGRA